VNQEEEKVWKFKRKFLNLRFFSFVLGAMVFLILSLVAWASPFHLFQRWDRELRDVFFQLRDVASPKQISSGVVFQKQNHRVSPAIVIVGVDDQSLDQLGRWPFERSVEADFLNSFTRISNPSERENSILLDFFFFDRSRDPENDYLLESAIQHNKKVVLESAVDFPTMDFQEQQLQYSRQEVFWKKNPELLKVDGNWQTMPSFWTLYADLKPFALAAASYGQATFVADQDKVFRRQVLVAKVTRILQETPLKELRPDLSNYTQNFQRYAWLDKSGHLETLPAPLTVQVISDLRKKIEQKGLPKEILFGTSVEKVYEVFKVQDAFIPSATLALALRYWNVPFNRIEVDLGKAIIIPDPMYFDKKLNVWKPLEKKGKIQSLVKIPIDQNAAMKINYAGPSSASKPYLQQTYDVRNFSGYVLRSPGLNQATWPHSLGMQNKLVLVGAFSNGMASDEKNTPFGPMFGVEIQANALNSILTQNFLHPTPVPLDILILLICVALATLISSRLSAIRSTVILVVSLLIIFIISLYLFDVWGLEVSLSVWGTGVILTYTSVILFRLLTEEKDKKRIRQMFSRYVSPEVVDRVLESPPELGGIDREVTIFFSDVRGFTGLSEKLSSQQLVQQLNEYFTEMTEILLKFKGTLDKYIGDAIMGFWGAPIEQPDHALAACRCAVAMSQGLKRLNSRWPEDRRMNIGIGINSGIVTVGNMGSQGRMNYTVSGDHVNLAARLEGANKEYGTQIIISESTYAQVKEHVIARELDIIRVKGKNKSVLIYELLDVKDQGI
jgi:adenylate cyclase